MKNKELKETRNRKFFVEAAKEIIMSEKIVAINVRDVSERAGFSPATLYAYFKDLNDLILHCVDSFVEDIEEFIKTEMNNNSSINSQIYKYFQAYTRYFIQYTGIYQLIFLESSSFIRNHKEFGKKIKNLYTNYLEISENEIDNMRNLNNSVNGLLLFYLNRNEPKDYVEFKNELEIILAPFK